MGILHVTMQGPAPKGPGYRAFRSVVEVCLQVRQDGHQPAGRDPVCSEADETPIVPALPSAAAPQRRSRSGLKMRRAPHRSHRSERNRRPWQNNEPRRQHRPLALARTAARRPTSPTCLSKEESRRGLPAQQPRQVSFAGASFDQTANPALIEIKAMTAWCSYCRDSCPPNGTYDVWPTW